MQKLRNKKLKKWEFISTDQNIVLLSTGSGLKYANLMDVDLPY